MKQKQRNKWRTTGTWAGIDLFEWSNRKIYELGVGVGGLFATRWRPTQKAIQSQINHKIIPISITEPIPQPTFSRSRSLSFRPFASSRLFIF